MIPMCKDQKIKYTIDGVTYLFHPPVGDLEIKLQEYLNKDNGADIKKAKSLYPEAVRILEKEYKGKRKPTKKKWNELIEEKLTSLMEAEDVKTADVEDGINDSKKIINMVLCGWQSKLSIPQFNAENPCESLTMPLIAKLMSWYWEQYSTTEDELKNL